MIAIKQTSSKSQAESKIPDEGKKINDIRKR